MNINMLRDQDDSPGFYVAACGADAGWKGAVLYQSVDDGASYNAVSNILKPATIGVATNALGDFHGGNIPDEINSLTVRLRYGTLASTTFAGLLEGAQQAVIGNEIVHFRKAVLNENGTYTMSGFLRGRRGSEFAMSTHAIGDRFVLLTNATIVRVNAAVSDIGRPKKYKAVTAGTSLSTTAAVDFTNAGACLKPYAPVHLGGGKEVDGAITINWVRRNRTGGVWRDEFDVPMTEASELYDIQIFLDDGYDRLVREYINVTDQTIRYSAGEQMVDWGELQDSLFVRVYQKSAILGRGYAIQGTVPATTEVVINTDEVLVIDPPVDPVTSTTKAITNIQPKGIPTYSNPAITTPGPFSVVTCPSHGFENGQTVTIDHVNGLEITYAYTRSEMVRLGRRYLPVNGLDFVISQVTTDTFVINLDSRRWMDMIDLGSTLSGPDKVYSPYISGGTATLQTTPVPYAITGITYTVGGTYSAYNTFTDSGTPDATSPLPADSIILMKTTYTAPGHTFVVGDIAKVATPTGTLAHVNYPPDPSGHGMVIFDFSEDLPAYNKLITAATAFVTAPYWTDTVKEVAGDTFTTYSLHRTTYGDSELNVYNSITSLTVTSGSKAMKAESMIFDPSTYPV